MKTKSTFLVILGFLSSAAVAQSTQSQMQPDSQPQAQSQGQAQSSGSSGHSESDKKAKHHQKSRASESSGDSSGMTSSGDSGDPTKAVVVRMEPKTENGFTYVCGGVGKDEAQAMKTAARDYDMMLEFATQKGKFLADVNVDIKDAKGKSELKTTCDGPMMLVKVPKTGTYHVVAETAGYKLDKVARVDKKGRNNVALVLTWPERVAEASGSGETSTGSSGRGGTSKSGTDSGNGDSNDNTNDNSTR
jgi:hypothetical protein